MSGLENRLGLSRWENPIWYAAGCRGAICVLVGSGETPVVVYGVLGDIDVTPTPDILLRGQGCEQIVGGLHGRG